MGGNEVRQNALVKEVQLLPTLKGILSLAKSIEAYTRKIDNEAVDGLFGVHNSLAYKVNEIERHLHNNEYWLGAAAVAVGETHVADEMGTGIAPFALLSGNDAYGNWVQVLGSEDTPIHADSVEVDAHRAMITTTNSTNSFHVQFVAGESADLAANILAKNYTGFPYISATNNADSGIADVMTRRILCGTKVWARTICIDADAKTINFYVGIHEYEG